MDPILWQTTRHELATARALRFEWQRDGRTHSGILVDDNGTPRAFENRCPHWDLPLDGNGARWWDERREQLVCTAHGARFALESGACLSGPCEGAELTALLVDIAGDVIRIRPAPLLQFGGLALLPPTDPSSDDP